MISMTPERRSRLQQVLAMRQYNITIVLENVFDPHNISAVMRTCDAVGIQDLYILNTRIPPHKKWGASSSASAAKWLNIHQYTDTAECFSVLRSKYDRLYTTHLSKDAASLYGLDLTTSVALIFGNEKDGVSEDSCRLADGNFIIPQVGIIRSLNISVACAVTLYEAYRQKTLAGHYSMQQGNIAARRELLQQWGLQEEDD
jgi:tRNA (guanosine-2'-O-)-methyltransferase